MSSGTGDKIEGKGDELKGTMKQGVGRVTGDQGMSSEGQGDELGGKGVVGAATNTVEKAGDALRNARGTDKK